MSDVKTILRNHRLRSLITAISGSATAASQSEVNAGTETRKYVSPATLAGWTGGGGASVASQAEVDSESNNTKAVSPLTLSKKALKSGTYSSELTFSADEDVIKDGTGLTLSFTLAASGNINGKSKILRIINPTSVTFDSNFIPSEDSSAFSSSELNVCVLTYYADYDGVGTERVVYKNANSLQAPVSEGEYSLELKFNHDETVYADVTDLSPSFTLSASDNVNGVVKFLRLNKPTSVSFSGDFQADTSSVAFNSSNLNVCLLIYFSDWDGNGNDKVIYSNKLFTAL